MSRARTPAGGGHEAEEFAAAPDEGVVALEPAASLHMPIQDPGQQPVLSAPRRDNRGRYRRAAGRTRSIRRGGAGLRGPSYLAQKPQPALVRICVDLEHRVGRLEAEWRRQAWCPPRKQQPLRMNGIRDWQKEGQDERLAALQTVLDSMSVDRLPRDMPRRHEEIATRMRDLLKANFHWRTLYTPPFRSCWMASAQVLDEHPADAAANASRLARWSKPLLVWRILRLIRRRDELLPLLSARLLSESLAEEGWEPIKRR